MEEFGYFIMTELVKVKNISFSYYNYGNSILYLKERMLRPNLTKPKSTKLFENISFSVDSGEIIALLGKNGVGKSTFLKLLCGVYSPSTGYVSRTGNLCPLIELGAAFHSELSGLENMRMFAAFLGLSNTLTPELEKEIMAWSNLDNQIYSSLRTYSSGMIARLAFATAIYLKPDLLILDEVLSVGDQDFKTKAKVALKEFVNFDRSVLLVSHDLSLVNELATQIVVISETGIKVFANPKVGLEFYMKEHAK